MKSSGASLSLAIHQPNYIPWLGYFFKMAHCDIFVYLDSVQYPRGSSFSPRNRIKTPNGATFLTVPVKVPEGRKGKAIYREIEFADQKWRDKHLKTITLSYKKTAFFNEIFPMFQQCVTSAERLLDLNISLIEVFAEYLQIESRRVKLSETLDEFGQKTDLIVDICQALGAEVYFSGAGGGLEYNDEKLLNQNGIRLQYAEYHHPQYPQLWGAFESHLSILDALFNCGPQTRQLIGL